MKLKVANGSELSVSDTTFGAPYNEALVHQIVTAYLAGARAGTKRQKNRSEVSGGGRKPWSQKGTGRARAGSIRSPLWVGGARAFAARPRNFEQKVNRKMYRAGIRSMLGELARTERLVVVEALAVAESRTKLFVEELNKLGLAGTSVLVIIEGQDEKLMLAARNVPHVEVITVPEINPVSLAAYDKVLMTVGAVKLIEERLQ
jgi:large subunit ribosomal protein L4